jgi:hypothetical protein
LAALSLEKELRCSMKEWSESRRRFLKGAGLTTAAGLLASGNIMGDPSVPPQSGDSAAAPLESGN